jgi:predicted ArsR family transcriptional regulator
MVNMEALAPCSIAELAASMGCRPATLYRHMRTLTGAGLLREAGRKSVGRRWASTYDLGPLYGLAHFDAPSGRGLREHGELVLALSRPAGRAYLRSVVAQRGTSQAKAKSRCTAMFERTWLDANSRSEAKRLMEALYRLVQRGRRTRRGERFQISLMAAPTVV